MGKSESLAVTHINGILCKHYRDALALATAYEIGGLSKLEDHFKNLDVTGQCQSHMHIDDPDIAPSAIKRHAIAVYREQSKVPIFELPASLPFLDSDDDEPKFFIYLPTK